MGMAIGATTKSLVAGLLPVVEDMLDGEVSFDAEEGIPLSGAEHGRDASGLARRPARAVRQSCAAEERTTLPRDPSPMAAISARWRLALDGGDAGRSHTVVDDFGVPMNPMLAEGSSWRWVLYRVALSEHVVYDETGQLLSATFMDYGMPRAADMPPIAFHTESVPSTANPMGMKGWVSWDQAQRRRLPMRFRMRFGIVASRCRYAVHPRAGLGAAAG